MDAGKVSARVSVWSVCPMRVVVSICLFVCSPFIVIHARKALIWSTDLIGVLKCYASISSGKLVNRDTTVTRRIPCRGIYVIQVYTLIGSHIIGYPCTRWWCSRRASGNGHFSTSFHRDRGPSDRRTALHVGRDYKAWSQMALFIISPYLTEGHQKFCWHCQM